MSKHSHSVHFGGGQSSLSSPGVNEGVGVTCHPERKRRISKAFTLAEVFSRHSDGQRRVAFTLAEVLITLGIIGVVAAMTLPTLIQNYQKKVTVNKLRKIYAELSQVIQLSEAEYGMIDTWNWVSQPGSNLNEKTEYLLRNYIIKRLKVAKVCMPNNYQDCGFSGLKSITGGSSGYGGPSALYVITTSGYSIFFHGGGNTETSEYSPHVHMIVDIDGPKKGESRLGKDCFVISAFFGKQVANASEPEKKSGVFMYGSGWIPALTRDELKNFNSSSALGCLSTGRMCGALIEADGWEIKDDYPW